MLDRIEVLREFIRERNVNGLPCSEAQNEFFSLVVEELVYLREEAKENAKLRKAMLEALR